MNELNKPKGAKTSRSETVSVRLDPKMRYLAELGARSHRRTLSSFIEWAIEDTLKRISLYHDHGNNFGNSERPSIIDEAEELWDIDEPDRVVSLALTHPSMLTHEEQVLWKLVRENGFFWKGRYEKREWVWKNDSSSIIHDRLRKYWNQFLKVARGEADKDTLPKWKAVEDSKEEETDIPF